MITIFKKIFFLLSTHERKHGALLIIMSILMALLDMIGVASIFPFMSVLSNPNVVETNIFLNFIFNFSSKFGIQNNQEFLLFLGVMVFLFLIISLTFKTFTVYALTQFVYMREYSIGKRIIEQYLRQPYAWFLSRNSTDFAKSILSEVAQIIGNGINPLIEITSKSFIAIALIILLFIVNPKLSLIVSSSLGFAYLTIYYFIHNLISQNGKRRLHNNQSRFRSVSEAFGAIKEVKVRGLEEIYIKNFSSSSQSYAKTIATAQVLAQLPRYILEAVAFGGILLIILFTMAKTDLLSESLPIISLYVFAGYRLLPALQQIYASFTKLAFVHSSVDNLYSDLKKFKSLNKNQVKEKITFNKTIRLNNICYNYPGSSRLALKDIDLNIPAKSIIGFIGTTGSGKTTLVDVILGILEPQTGSLEIDGKTITDKNLTYWQQLIGYVPQHIYLSDDTIAANIAFGVEPEDINQNILEKVSKIAKLHEFIIDELPKQYLTEIGERGIKLSGGQRQRIGIARALYRDPKVLILDEATSALDTETEQFVMNEINNIDKNKTIILIAHRLNTLKNCDIVFRLNKGSIANKGTFDEIVNE